MSAYILKIERLEVEQHTIDGRRVLKAQKFLQQVKNTDTSFHESALTHLEYCKQYAKHVIRELRTRSRNETKSVYVSLSHKARPDVVYSRAVSLNEVHGTIREFFGLAKDGVRRARQERRVNCEHHSIRYLPGGAHVAITRIGGLIKPGQLAAILAERRAKIVFTAKRPLNQENHIGIELEFIAQSDRNELGKMLVKAELGQYVHLKSDGSIRVDRSGYSGHELSACIPESQRKVVISKIADVLKEAGALINKSCGFHVHLDMRSRDRRKAFSNLVSAQNVFYAMNPKSRKDNTYCKKTRSKDLDKEVGGSRYKGINANALGKFGTLEIRVHSGTVDEAKINNWIDLLISVADADAPFKRAPRTIDSFCKGYNIPSELRSYIIERIRKFNGGDDISEVSEVG